MELFGPRPWPGDGAARNRTPPWCAAAFTRPLTGLHPGCPTSQAKGECVQDHLVFTHGHKAATDGRLGHCELEGVPAVLQGRHGHLRAVDQGAGDAVRRAQQRTLLDGTTAALETASRPFRSPSRRATAVPLPSTEFGPATRDALEYAHSQEGITVDGQYGEQGFNHLEWARYTQDGTRNGCARDSF